MALHDLDGSTVRGALDLPGQRERTRAAQIESIYRKLQGCSTGKPAAMAIIQALERRVEAAADTVAARLSEGDAGGEVLERLAGELLAAQNTARLARNLLDKFSLTKRWHPHDRRDAEGPSGRDA